MLVLVTDEGPLVVLVGDERPLEAVVVFVFDLGFEALGTETQYAALLPFVTDTRTGLATPRPLRAMRRSCARPAL